MVFKTDKGEFMLYFLGRISKSSKTKTWLVEIPSLDVQTQGRTQKEALEMLKEATDIVIGVDGIIKAYDEQKKDGTFRATLVPDPKIFARVLSVARENSGKTLDQVCKELGYKSRNGFSQYERGVKVPSVAKFAELLTPFNSGPMIF